MGGREGAEVVTCQPMPLICFGGEVNLADQKAADPNYVEEEGKRHLQLESQGETKKGARSREAPAKEGGR